MFTPKQLQVLILALYELDDDSIYSHLDSLPTLEEDIESTELKLKELASGHDLKTPLHWRWS